jgi:YVTN family beta-propeller protein
MLAWVGAVVAIAAAPAAASAATGYVLTCSCENVVTVIDTATRSIVDTIPVGDEPRSIAVAPDGSAAYVAQRVEESIAVIDGTTHTVAREIPLDDGDEPFGIAISPDGATLWVLVSDLFLSEQQLLRVDAASGAILDRADVGPMLSPFDTQLAISPDGTRLYTASWWSLSRFDLTQPGFPGIDITPAGSADPTAVAVAPDGTLYVPMDDDTVLHLDAAGGQIGSPIPLSPADFGPGGIALDPTGAHAWVAGTPMNEASVIDLSTQSVQPTTGIDDINTLVAVSPDGDGVYVGSFTDALLHVVDPQTRARVATIRLGDDSGAIPLAIVFGPAATPPPPPPSPATGGRPVVTAVSPAEGTTAGGEEVRITGANFGTGVRALFGDTPATARVVDFNTIVATVPPSANAGRVRVSVAAPDGLRSIEDVGYRYAEPPPASLTAPSTTPPRPACVVPDVRGLRLRTARTRLEAANCTVGFVSRIRGRRHQRVVRQSLRPGTQRPGGWGVALAIRPRPAR